MNNNDMEIMGINSTRTEDGKVNTTLQVSYAFPAYYNSPEKGRTCQGCKVESIFCGTYDCSALKVGMKIKVYYDRAVSSSKGTFQNVSLIQIVSK